MVLRGRKIGHPGLSRWRILSWFAFKREQGPPSSSLVPGPSGIIWKLILWKTNISDISTTQALQVRAEQMGQKVWKLSPTPRCLSPPNLSSVHRGWQTAARKVSELPATCLGLTPGSCPFSLAALAIARTFLKAEAVHWGLLLERPEEGPPSPWGPCCSLALPLSHTLLRAWGLTRKWDISLVSFPKVHV